MEEYRIGNIGVDGEETVTYTLKTYEEYKTGENYTYTDAEVLDIKMGTYFSVFSKDNIVVTIDVILTSNIFLYFVEVEFCDENPSCYEFVFDDEKLLSETVYSSDKTTCYGTTNYEYTLVEFDDSLIPEEYRETAN